LEHFGFSGPLARWIERAAMPGHRAGVALALPPALAAILQGLRPLTIG